MRMISHYAGTRDNNFNLLRFAAAFSVVITHSTVVVRGSDAVEPLFDSTGYTLGHHAVDVFFIISGFLIAGSLARSRDLFDYFAARGLRLLPGLAVATAVTAFVIGPIVTQVDLAAYFSDWSTYLYAPLSTVTMTDDLRLAGVFTTTPSPDEINTPLWTLRWEALAYVGLAAMAVAGLMATARRFALAAGTFLALYLAVTLLTDWRSDIAPVEHSLRLTLAFLIGASFSVFRERIPLSFAGVVAAWGMAVAFAATGLYEFALKIAIAYSVLWLAYVPGGAIRRFNDLGDPSYGIYIYGFPIQQTTILALPGLTPAQLLFTAAPFILAAAFLSFYLVEQPALAQRWRLAAWLRQSLGRAVPAHVKTPDALTSGA